MATLEYTMNFQVKEGPQIDMPKTSLQIEAYDVTEVVLQAATPPAPPADTAAQQVDASKEQAPTQPPTPQEGAPAQQATEPQPPAPTQETVIEQTVLILAGNAEKVTLMAITSDKYDEDITLCASDGTNQSACIKLDAPKIFFGSGAVSLLAVHPQKLKITGRNLKEQATIKIFVGRSAQDG